MSGPRDGGREMMHSRQSGSYCGGGRGVGAGWILLPILYICIESDRCARILVHSNSYKAIDWQR